MKKVTITGITKENYKDVIFDLCYFSYEKNIYKEDKKEEIALTAEQFMNQNVLDFPIKRFL